MTPNEFLDQVVHPNVADFHANYASIRHAFNAIASVDSLAAHLFDWCKANHAAEVINVSDDSHYRSKLAQQSQQFGLLRDIAKAQKHVHLTKHNPGITRGDQINVRPIGFGQGGYGCGRYGGPPQVVVDTNDGGFQYVEEVVDGALKFLEAEILRLTK